MRPDATAPCWRRGPDWTASHWMNRPRAARWWKAWVFGRGALGDPPCGLKVASQIKPTSFHALSYGISASSTLKEAFERAQRYCHIGTDAVDYEFLKIGAEYHWIIAPAVD